MALNWTAFSAWLQTRNLTLSSKESEAFRLLKIDNFHHQPQAKTFTIILTNSQLLPFMLLKNFLAKIVASDLRQITWIYRDLQLNSAAIPMLRDYLDVFFTSQKMKQFSYQLQWQPPQTLVLIAEEHTAFQMFHNEILLFLENWGIAISHLIITDKLADFLFSPSKLSGFTPPLSVSPSAVSDTGTDTKLNARESISAPLPSLKKNSLQNIIATKIPLNKKKLRNNRFLVQGKILTVDSNTFNNQMVLKLLVDRGSRAIILETSVKYEDAQILTPLRPQQWFKFECFHSSKDKKQVFFDSFTPQPSQFPRADSAPLKRIELHTHTKMSALDGVASAEAFLETVAEWGHSAIAFTDHENVHIFPELNNLIDKYPAQKIIFGCEFNTIDSNLTVLSHPLDVTLKQQKIVFIDLETTGLSLMYDDIIEFAAVTMEKGLKTHETSFLIASNKPITATITEITGITQQEHAEQHISIENALKRIAKILAGAVIVAHNSNFDIGFLQELFRRHNKRPLVNPVIDTLNLAYSMLEHLKSFRLGRLARYFGVYYDQKKAHRALYDAQILCEIYSRLLDKGQIKTFSQLHQLNQNHKLKTKAHAKRLNVLVRNPTGLRNLYLLVSQAHTKNLYDKPILERALLTRYREGLFVGSGGYEGEIFESAYLGNADMLREKIKFYDYIQIQPPEVYRHLVEKEILRAADIQDVLRRIIIAAQAAKIPVVATGDVYFLEPKDSIYRDIYIFNKQLKGKPHRLFDSKNRLTGSPPQYLRTTEEMLKAFAFLKDSALIEEIVIHNPHKIANQIEKIRCFPQELSMTHLPDAEIKLKTMAQISLQKKYGSQPDAKVQKRFDSELNQILRQGYATIYLIAHRLTQFSLQNNYLIGSRGSVGSSFLAFCLEITEVNPLDPHYHCTDCGTLEWADIKKYHSGFDLPARSCSNCQKLFHRDGHSIPFESFLGLDSRTIPDIDLNFSGAVQEKVQKFATDWLEKVLGPQKIFRAGTISTVASKTAYGYYRNYVEMKKLPTPEYAEVQKIIANITGVKRTTGQHPGGLMILPKEYEVFEFTPYNYPSNNKNELYFTTHFDYHALNTKLLKIDILGHDDPTALRMLEEMTGRNPKTIPLAEPGIIQTFSATGAVGLPEFGTEFVRRILEKKPVKTFADLISVSGLSHGTNVWESNAKNLLEAHPDFGFQDVIACRDDIMNFLLKWKIDKVSAYNYMQHVKKGKGFSKEEINHLLKNGVEKWFIDSCSKIRYLFPKAHATAYVIMSYRLAWYKIHFPAEFYATFFSIRCEVFDLSTITQGTKAIQTAMQAIQKKIKLTPREVTPKEKNLLGIYEVALEMWNRQVVELRPLNLNYSQAQNFIVRQEKTGKVIYPPFAAVDQLGVESATKIVAARTEKPFTDQEDFRHRTKINQAIFENLGKSGVFANLRKSSQIQFDFN